MGKIKIRNLFSKKGSKIDENYGRNVLPKERVFFIPCDSIRPSSVQPRADFDGEEMQKLTASVKNHGILQPLTVKKTEADDIYEFELISGERRLRAAKLLDMYSVPCRIVDISPQNAAETAMIESISVSKLNMFELARGIHYLLEDMGASADDIAMRLPMGRNDMLRKLKLLDLSYEEQCAVLRYSLSERHARALLALNSHEDRMYAIRIFAEKLMTPEEAEEFASKMLTSCGGVAPSSEERFLSALSELSATSSDKTLCDALQDIKEITDELSKNGRAVELELFRRHGAVELGIRVEM